MFNVTKLETKTYEDVFSLILMQPANGKTKARKNVKLSR